jgi:antirestriction protein ArdC
MANEKNKELLEETLNNLIERIEKAGNWIQPFKNAIANGMPTNYKSKEEYKGVNIFNLWSIALDKGYSSNQWLTFNQAKELELNIKKGEKSTPIFFFKPIKMKKEDEESGETMEEIIPMMKVYRVFNIDQTTLEQSEKIEHKKDIKSFFDSLDFIDIIRGNPAYNVTRDLISMPHVDNFISIDEYYSTLAHEYIHSTRHESRLNRYKGPSKEDYALEELIAEIGTVFMMAHLGIKEDAVQDNNAAYLKGWLSELKNDKKYLWKAAAQAQKAYSYLIDYIESKENLEEAA